MELENNSELKNETRCVIKFCNSLGIRAPETVKLIKKDYKVNVLMILRFLDDMVIKNKKNFFGRIPLLSVISGLPEIVVNDRNVNTVLSISLENR